MNPAIFISAYLLDLIIGDPEWLPHPVRLIGWITNSGERMIRRIAHTPWSEFFGGLLLTVSIITVMWISTAWVVHLLGRWNQTASFLASIYLASTTLTTHCLVLEVRRIYRLLESGHIEGARRHLSRIVGRDTDDLDVPDIVRAAIESAAESASDGIVAPMFYLALGGIPAAFAYKVINTMDSMIGHQDTRYRYFGKFAARVDDAVNFFPARITAFLITASAFLCRFDWQNAWKVWQRDAGKHASPNAGRPEAAMAGALGVRLGGLNFYGGEACQGAYLGEARVPLNIESLKRSIVIVLLVSLLSFMMLLSLLTYIYGR
ncbi:adenosylcobinamide-phosphate synthase CbiB [bacterium]|nr:adenosylcobinamide-phosphate synthase CbiB [bacterium]